MGFFSIFHVSMMKSAKNLSFNTLTGLFILIFMCGPVFAGKRHFIWERWPMIPNSGPGSFAEIIIRPEGKQGHPIGDGFGENWRRGIPQDIIPANAKWVDLPNSFRVCTLNDEDLAPEYWSKEYKEELAQKQKQIDAEKAEGDRKDQAKKDQARDKKERERKKNLSLEREKNRQEQRKKEISDAEDKIRNEEKKRTDQILASSNKRNKEKNLLIHEVYRTEIDNRDAAIAELCKLIHIQLPLHNTNNLEIIDHERQISLVQGSDSIALKGCYERYLQIDPISEIVSTCDHWAGAWESFVIEKIENNGKWIFIRSKTGKYLGATSEGHLYATSNKGESEQFILEEIDGNENTVQIRTSHGQYIAFSDHGQVFTYSNPIPKKNVVLLEGSRSVAIRGAFGKYLIVDSDHQVLTGDSQSGNSRFFELENVKDHEENNSVYIRTSTGLYLGASPVGLLYVTSNKGSWEQFIFERIEGSLNSFYIKTSHGSYFQFFENGNVTSQSFKVN